VFIYTHIVHRKGWEANAGTEWENAGVQCWACGEWGHFASDPNFHPERGGKGKGNSRGGKGGWGREWREPIQPFAAQNAAPDTNEMAEFNAFKAQQQQAKADANGANDDSEKKDSSLLSDESKKRKLPKVDLGCINATVELTSLFEPPLLSEWGTPGVNMNTSYDDKNDEEESFDDSDSDESYVHRANTSNKNNDDKSKETSAAEQIESALGKLVQCAAATKGATQVDESIKQIFHNTTGASLLECLPSRMLLQKVQDAASTAADGASYLQIGVTTLTLLADIAQAESMGRHILSVLAPVLLSSPSASCTSMGKERNYFATSVELLAKALIHRCGLGELSKADLLKLAESGELGRSEEPSEFMDLLLIALGKAYHE